MDTIIFLPREGAWGEALPSPTVSPKSLPSGSVGLVLRITNPTCQQREQLQAQSKLVLWRGCTFGLQWKKFWVIYLKFKWVTNPGPYHIPLKNSTRKHPGMVLYFERQPGPSLCLQIRKILGRKKFLHSHALLPGDIWILMGYPWN